MMISRFMVTNVFVIEPVGAGTLAWTPVTAGRIIRPPDPGAKLTRSAHMIIALAATCAAAVGCANRPATVAPASVSAGTPTLAQVYFWKARGGKLADYDRYIREVAE